MHYQERTMKMEIKMEMEMNLNVSRDPNNYIDNENKRK